ncbi:MAG: class I SAM-dependent methyltransferase [Patescibacteria group bacterium]
MSKRDLEKAALRGEPSYVWRAGQERRLEMILRTAGERIQGCILEDGCGVGMYIEHLQVFSGKVFGLEYDFERVREAHQRSDRSAPARTPGRCERSRRSLVTCAAGEALPYPADNFDLILSHEVLEHVRDDRQAVEEIFRVLKPGGRLVLFVPSRGYPFETHGIYWRGKYHFGNIPLVNYLPRRWRDRLAPHVRVYSRRDLEKLFAGLPLGYVERSIIFGAYDNLIARFGWLGKFLRLALQWLEKTPLKALGLSHFWVVEKLTD